MSVLSLCVTDWRGMIIGWCLDRLCAVTLGRVSRACL